MRYLKIYEEYKDYREEVYPDQIDLFKKIFQYMKKISEGTKRKVESIGSLMLEEEFSNSFKIFSKGKLMWEWYVDDPIDESDKSDIVDWLIGDDAKFIDISLTHRFSINPMEESPEPMKSLELLKEYLADLEIFAKDIAKDPKVEIERFSFDYRAVFEVGYDFSKIVVNKYSKL